MKTRIDDQREQHVAQWRASGLSRAAYCREKGLPYQQFLPWTKTMSLSAPAANPSAFIEVLQPATCIIDRPSASLASITLPGGVQLRVVVGTDADWIGRVVSAVRSC